ncbi:hypothetical protein X737_22355 [Mesorhizobium sp. L48C026A00]|nr:hypothetical protein X737_22355 [Mesorhizobium sp. L48C026A00]
MIVVLENSCGDRGKAIAAMMAMNAWALHRCAIQRSPPGIEQRARRYAKRKCIK